MPTYRKELVQKCQTVANRGSQTIAAGWDWTRGLRSTRKASWPLAQRGGLFLVNPGVIEALQSDRYILLKLMTIRWWWWWWHIDIYDDGDQLEIDDIDLFTPPFSSSLTWFSLAFIPSPSLSNPPPPAPPTHPKVLWELSPAPLAAYLSYTPPSPTPPATLRFSRYCWRID